MNYDCPTDWLTLTYYMEQRTSWEVIFPQLFKKFPKFYRTCRFVAAFARVCHFFLSWARWIQSTQLSCFHKSGFNAIHTSELRFSKWSLQVSSPKFCMPVCSLCVPHALPLSFSLSDHPRNTLWAVHIIKLPTVQFSPVCCYFLPPLLSP